MEELEDVKKELEAKRQELAAELESAKGRVLGIAGDLRRVDDALRALTKRKGKARGRAKPSPQATTEESARASARPASSFFFDHEPLQ